MPDKKLKQSDEKRPLKLTEKQRESLSGAIYQFKVTLKESHPPIWWRIRVRDCTLGEFHEVLQIIMGWENCHLHQFIIRGEQYETPDPEDAYWDREVKDEQKLSIGQIAIAGRTVRFDYDYDFGDSWQHVDWIGGAFLPEKFDVSAVNQKLKML